MGTYSRSHIELGRRLCAAYVSFVMRTRRFDAVLSHMPKKISSFWIELARLVALRAGTRTSPEGSTMLDTGHDTQGTHGRLPEGGHTLGKRKNTVKRLPRSTQQPPT